MKTSKTFWLFLFVGLLGAIVFWQSRVIHTHQNKKLEILEKIQEKQMTTYSSASELGIEKPAHSTNKMNSLRRQSAELYRLRGDVTMAQQKYDELLTQLLGLESRLELRPDPTAEENPPEYPPGYRPRHELGNRGMATPDAAVETFWWSLINGNHNTLCDVVLEYSGMSVNEVNFNSSPKEKMGIFESFPGYRIAHRMPISANVIRVGAETLPGGDMFMLRLVATNGVWKISRRNSDYF